MKLKVLTTCDNINHPGYLRLKTSLEKFGYDFECIVHPFAFGHQMTVIRDYCRRQTENHYILYTDAFDTLAFSDPKEVILKFISFGAKMVISTEKACYPHHERAKDYPESESPWKYVNGGGWITDVNFFNYICEKENLNNESHDQIWLMETFLRNQGDIGLDTGCQIFQTIAFSNQDEWEKQDGRFFNKQTKSLPIFFHGNGRTEMTWVNQST